MTIKKDDLRQFRNKQNLRAELAAFCIHQEQRTLRMERKAEESLKAAKCAREFKNLEEAAEEIANLICNPRYHWTDNIVLPTSDTYTHKVSVIEDDEDEALCQREFDQVLIDGGSVGDVFRWYYTRDIPLPLADAEDTIGELTDELDAHRRHCLDNYYPEGIYRPSYAAQKEIRRGIHLRTELDEYSQSVDMAYVPDDIDHIDTPSIGAGIYTYLEMYIDRMSLGELAFIMDVLEDLHASKDLSWYYYVQCGLAVCYRLHRACPKGGWGATLANLRKHNQVNHTKTTSYEDRFFGEMNFSMESAIDLMDEARSIASGSDQDLYDTFCSMLEQQEVDPTMWVPTLEDID